MQKIIAANWKMNKVRAEASATTKVLAENLRAGEVADNRQVFVFPPFTAIDVVANEAKGLKNFVVGGQDLYTEESGAFTGEISAEMLKDAGATWVLTGHSERRHILHESDEFVADKTAFALTHGLGAMLCIGETLQEREAGLLQNVLDRQLSTAIKKFPQTGVKISEKVIIAYEPVWAIGTGKVAGPAEALDAHATVRKILVNMLGEVGQNLPILYGGSVKPNNASELLSLENVNGLLVGGASLDAETFLRIVKA